MTKHGTLRRATDRQRHVRDERHREPTESRSASGAIEDLWDVIGVRYPGSPRNSKSEPVDILMIDGRGKKVLIARKKKTRFRNPGTRPDVMWLWRPEVNLCLWVGPHNFALTHALRLLQVCSSTFEGHHRRSEERTLRGAIQPERLLQECGASANLASLLVGTLIEKGLLQSREHLGSEPVWFINMRVRGFGSQLENLDASELPEMILPEALVPPESEPQDAPTEERSAAMAAVETEGEQGSLTRAYLYLRDLVPESAEIQDGFSLFIPDNDLKGMVARELGLSEHKAKELISKLQSLGLYKSESGGRGKPWRRYLKLEALEAVQTADSPAEPPERDGDHRRAASSRPASEPVEAKSVEATSEQLNELFQQISTKLDDYKARAEELEQQLSDERTAHAATRAELEELKKAPPTPKFVLPAELARHLED